MSPNISRDFAQVRKVERLENILYIGSLFEGSYYNDVDSVGIITWNNGDTFRGELGVINAGYDIDPHIVDEKLVAIGQYVEGTVTSRGFFVLNDNGRFDLIDSEQISTPIRILNLITGPENLRILN